MQSFVMFADNELRNVILHMHFPKTGGSTLNSILNREFGKKHYALSFFRPKNTNKSPNPNICWNDAGKIYENPELTPVWEFGATDIFDMLEHNQDAMAVSRHGMFLDPVHLNADDDTCDKSSKDVRNEKYNLFPIFFLRKTPLWHMSFYFQQRRDQDNLVRLSYDHRLIVAKTGNLREYTQFCVENMVDLNHHKIMYNWSDHAVDMMVRHIGLYQIGITERYDESLAVMEHMLADHFPGIDLSYAARVNVDENRKNNTEIQNMSELREHLGEELLKKFTKSHERSTKLYKIVDAELDKRISRIQDFDQKMSDFERRCKRHALAEHQ